VGRRGRTLWVEGVESCGSKGSTVVGRRGRKSWVEEVEEVEGVEGVEGVESCGSKGSTVVGRRGRQLWVEGVESRGSRRPKRSKGSKGSKVVGRRGRQLLVEEVGLGRRGWMSGKVDYCRSKRSGCVEQIGRIRQRTGWTGWTGGAFSLLARFLRPLRMKPFSGIYVRIYLILEIRSWLSRGTQRPSNIRRSVNAVTASTRRQPQSQRR
jgi:hypothetical protein